MLMPFIIICFKLKLLKLKLLILFIILLLIPGYLLLMQLLLPLLQSLRVLLHPPFSPACYVCDQFKGSPSPLLPWGICHNIAVQCNVVQYSEV